MSRWVGVHGIGQQYESGDEILQKWIPALSGGVRWATDRRFEPDLDLAFYGHLFRRAEPRTRSRPGKGATGEDLAADLADLDEAELADLTAAVEDIVGAGVLAEAAARPSKVAMWLPVPVQHLVGAVERRFPPASGILLLGTLRQVRRYLRDPRLKSEVDRITAEAGLGATVLIGHSLGSVAAYEFLRQNPGHSVRLLLTVGSPLGLRMVRDRMPGAAPGLPRWVNVRDPHDPVTAAGALDRWFPRAEDGYADNGSQAHDANRYLNCKATGAALADFLPEPGR